MLSAAVPLEGLCFCASVCQLSCPQMSQHLQRSQFSFLPEMELECRRMCQGALKGFAGILSVSLNCCLHGDTFYLYCWPVGFEGIPWVQFYFQIPISHLYLSLFQLSYQIDSHKYS